MLTIQFPTARKGAGNLDAMLTRSDALAAERQPHMPFLALVTSTSAPVVSVEHTLTIVKHQSIKALLAADYAPDTIILKQWPGKTRSDWFQFTLGELTEWLTIDHGYATAGPAGRAIAEIARELLPDGAPPAQEPLPF